MANADSLTADHLSLNTTITTTAQKLRALTQRSQQSEWHFSLKSLSLSEVLVEERWQQWAIAPLNEKGHIAWARGKQSIWLCQQITVPTTLNGFSVEGLALRLGLTWWAEAVEIFVDGHLVQEGDLFDYFVRLLLSDRVSPGDTFTVTLHLLSPGHDDGALVRSEVIYTSADPDLPEPGFVADELTVLQTYAEKLAPEKLATIAAAIAPLDWAKVSQPREFLAELAALRTRLHPLSDWLKQRQFTCVGHAHLDLAWLWPVEDTWQAAERTFRSVLSLQTTFPELTYTHSSPALFDWLETHQPELFQTILTAVRQGTWTIDAGLWVEPELNTLGGESLARQILYGQRYSRSRFGRVSAIAWLPDSFGFSWQLPQLLKLGGIDYFATQKLRWNEATRFPHSLFWWQGLDGTAILSLTLPPIGTDVDPIQMATHGAAWEATTHLREMLWLPGMGDHGGGPTRDMLESAQRWATSPFFPQLTFASPLEHLERLSGAIAPPSAGLSTDDDTAAFPCSPEATTDLTSSLPNDASPAPPSTAPLPLPIWQDELYLELHRGCYTVHADQKWFNRRCEDTLREAELFATLAHLQNLNCYPRADLERAWKQVLFNQFHDILPGTAIPEVFETANRDWQTALDTAVTLRTEALEAIAAHLTPPIPPHHDALPLFVFNSLNWEHTDIVEVPLAKLPAGEAAWRILDAASGEDVPVQVSFYTEQPKTPPCQPVPAAERSARLLFLATVPAVGYRLYWLVPAPPDVAPTQSPPPTPVHFYLENDLIRAAVSPITGELTELWEKSTQSNLLGSPANQLQAFQDTGQYWDAWDIAPNYQDHPLPAAMLKSVEWLEAGPLRQRLRVVRQVADSTIQQDYVLDQHLPYLKVSTVAEWQAEQVVLKAAFPLSIESAQATYEIPFGAIARPTNPTNPHEQAKWEVPAYRWADLSNDEVGLSILTDYKHGFDAKPHQLRLTLLKAPLWPDPLADRGRHHFTYALYPHAGDWRSSQTPHWAIAFNTELHPVLGIASSLASEPATTPAAAGSTFLNWQTTGVHLAALKLAEDSSQECVLRFWEMYGEEANLDAGSAILERTNLLEEAIAVESPNRITPWQIATFKVSALNNSLRNLPTAHSQD